MPEIGPPGSESGGRKRTHGSRPAARRESAGSATDPPTGHAPPLDSTRTWSVPSRAGCGKPACPVRRAATGNGAMARSEAPALGESRREQQPPPPTATAPVVDSSARIGVAMMSVLGHALVMLYSFARVSAVLAMRRHDYFGQGSRGWLRLHEKGGKRYDVPAHHRPAAALDAYVEATGLEDPKAMLFQTLDPAGTLADAPGARSAARSGDDQKRRDRSLPQSRSFTTGCAKFFMGLLVCPCRVGCPGPSCALCHLEPCRSRLI